MVRPSGDSQGRPSLPPAQPGIVHMTVSTVIMNYIYLLGDTRLDISTSCPPKALDLVVPMPEQVFYDLEDIKVKDTVSRMDSNLLGSHKTAKDKWYINNYDYDSARDPTRHLKFQADDEPLPTSKVLQSAEIKSVSIAFIFMPYIS